MFGWQDWGVLLQSNFETIVTTEGVPTLLTSYSKSYENDQWSTKFQCILKVDAFQFNKALFCDNLAYVSKWLLWYIGPESWHYHRWWTSCIPLVIVMQYIFLWAQYFMVCSRKSTCRFCRPRNFLKLDAEHPGKELTHFGCFLRNIMLTIWQN